MKRNLIIGLIVGLVIAVIVVAMIASRSKKRTETESAENGLTEETQTDQKASVSLKLKDYSDPAGFKFSYPDDLKLNANKITSDNVYSDLRLTSDKTSGRVIVKITGTSLKTVADWLKQNKYSSGGSTLMKDIKLADMQGKEIKKDKTLITVAIDDYQTLYLIEVDLNGNEKYWTDASQAITRSFAFVAPAASSDSSSGASDYSGDGVIFEGEEEVQ